MHSISYKFLTFRGLNFGGLAYSLANYLQWNKRKSCLSKEAVRKTHCLLLLFVIPEF